MPRNPGALEPVFPRRAFVLLVGLALLAAGPAFWAAEVENATIGLVALTLVTVSVLGSLFLLQRHYLALFLGPRWGSLAALPPALFLAGFMLNVWGYYQPGAARRGLEARLSTGAAWLFLLLWAAGLIRMAFQVRRRLARKG